MQRLRFHSSLATFLLAVALVLSGTATLLAQPVSHQSGQTSTWVLSQGAVGGAGKAVQSKAGQLTAGHEVQAVAQAQGAAGVPAGNFTIKYTVEEKGGIYILRGAWDLTKPGAAKATHHTPDSIRGTLYAELSFNPATTTGTIDAKVFVSPKRRTGGKAVKAAGTFTGNERFEGTLTLSRLK
jgi:hypothetical protein